jgi:hypothetical protein
MPVDGHAPIPHSDQDDGTRPHLSLDFTDALSESSTGTSNESLDFADTPLDFTDKQRVIPWTLLTNLIVRI